MRLSGKRAVITGAASGIGEAVAEGFAREGAAVMCLDLNAPGAEVVAARIRSSGATAASAGCDITRFDSVEAALVAAINAVGSIDILFANAGGLPNSDTRKGGGIPFLDLTPDRWAQMIGLNLTGAFYCGLVFARHMASIGGGSIVFTASQLAEVARPGMGHYAAAKGGLRQLVKGMALDLAQHNIRVNALAPGVTVTGLNRNRMQIPEVRELTARAIPLGRPAESSEMVGVVVYLASDEASYTTGQTIFVDGGWTII